MFYTLFFFLDPVEEKYLVMAKIPFSALDSWMLHVSPPNPPFPPAGGKDQSL